MRAGLPSGVASNQGGLTKEGASLQGGLTRGLASHQGGLTRGLASHQSGGTTQVGLPTKVVLGLKQGWCDKRGPSRGAPVHHSHHHELNIVPT